MVSIWMLYASGVALLLGAAAWIVERGCLAACRPTRWIWAASIAGSLLLPIIFSGTPGDPNHPAAPLGTERPRAQVGAPVAALDDRRPGGWRSDRDWIDRTAGFGWLLGSTALVTTLFLSGRTLARRRQQWAHRRISGRAVRIAPETGPALVGFVWPEIVIPSWALGWDPEAQDLLVAHEAEHDEAGDPYLLLFALAALIVYPWNLPLWWQMRRLRGAIEVDCDARVLSRTGSTREYGRLLIEVGRVSSHRFIPVPAFSESRSLLERRIRLLARPAARSRRALVLASLTVPLFLTGAVYALPNPLRPHLGLLWEGGAPAAEQPRNGASGERLRNSVVRVIAYEESEVMPVLRNQAEFTAAVAERYARTRGGVHAPSKDAVFWVLVDEEGVAEQARIARSSGVPGFDVAAERAIRQAARFRPAWDAGRRARAWIELPVVAGAADPGSGTGEAYRVPLSITPGSASPPPGARRMPTVPCEASRVTDSPDGPRAATALPCGPPQSAAPR